MTDRPPRYLDLLRAEAGPGAWRVGGAALASGVAGGLVVAVVNAGAQLAPASPGDLRLFLLFLGCAWAALGCRRFAFREVAAAVESLATRYQLRIADRLRRGDLATVEALGEARVYNIVANATRTLTEGSRVIVDGVAATATVVVAGAYLSRQSPPALIAAAAILGIGVGLHFARRRSIEASIGATMTKEDELFRLIKHELSGFKEVRLNEDRRRELVDERIDAAIHAVAAQRRATQSIYDTNFVMTLTLYYVLLAVVAALFPVLGLAEGSLAIQVITTLLFVGGPLAAVVGSLPFLGRADAAVKSLVDLERAIPTAEDAENDAADGAETAAPPAPTSWRSLALRDISHSYRGEDGETEFSIGPVDFAVVPGEVVFIVGGNGGGKTTFLKLLTGLYVPGAGRLELDDAPVERQAYPSYRELFSVVFSDYHLFERFYGMSFDRERAEELLSMMQLSGKTTFDEQGFAFTDLSVGQRKRLALIQAILEDRPIYVFDEWAADQDPEFRRAFYERIVPDLKSRGKTVIAVTHDDQYFSAADRLLIMNSGRLAPHALN